MPFVLLAMAFSSALGLIVGSPAYDHFFLGKWIVLPSILISLSAILFSLPETRIGPSCAFISDPQLSCISTQLFPLLHLLALIDGQMIGSFLGNQQFRNAFATFYGSLRVTSYPPTLIDVAAILRDCHDTSFSGNRSSNIAKFDISSDFLLKTGFSQIYNLIWANPNSSFVNDNLWHAPPPGWIALKIDGAIGRLSSIGYVGGLAHESLDNWIRGFSKPLGKHPLFNPNIGDCMRVSTSLGLNVLRRAIASLLHRTWAVDFKLIGRDSNSTVDTLAKFSLQHTSDHLFLGPAPFFLHDVLQRYSNDLH
ncbi:hypothetical protein F3Y22_tig00117012pilonHSYRG00014 [Hibiscus syriacus]|uniref:RNase H type-1 domain-containing protein n=1 Tax=Hibiscus syriacus TaxID=106335 RepID=A0A6A2WEU6_HIBSY|nr:hypothetical protein F3Y22_tig00117012pilonHSYRG00014 [Hibiscus syriacus]